MPPFFGLEPSPQVTEAVLLEPIFILMYYMGFTWESFGIGPLPTSYRDWFITRINKEIDKSQDKTGDGGMMGGDIPTKAAHHNDAQTRALTNKVRHFNRNPRTQRPGSIF